MSYNEAFDECKAIFQRKLGKQFSEFTTQEKAYLCDITHDRVIGRMSLFLRWTDVERNGFLSWLKEMNVEYSELEDAERWAYEDAYSIVE